MADYEAVAEQYYLDQLAEVARRNRDAAQRQAEANRRDAEAQRFNAGLKMVAPRHQPDHAVDDGHAEDHAEEPAYQPQERHHSCRVPREESGHRKPKRVKSPSAVPQRAAPQHPAVKRVQEEDDVDLDLSQLQLERRSTERPSSRSVERPSSRSMVQRPSDSQMQAHYGSRYNPAHNGAYIDAMYAAAVAAGSKVFRGVYDEENRTASFTSGSRRTVTRETEYPDGRRVRETSTFE